MTMKLYFLWSFHHAWFIGHCRHIKLSTFVFFWNLNQIRKFSMLAICLIRNNISLNNDSSLRKQYCEFIQKIRFESMIFLRIDIWRMVMKNRSNYFQKDSSFFFLVHRTSSGLLWINWKSVSRCWHCRRLILNRLNKFANIECYWKIIGKARIVGSKAKFHCLGRCMVIDNKTGWNIIDRN